jgi:ATP-dependent protease ClpP protease subunit
MDRDFIVRGEQAVAYGLVDHVIERRELAEPLAAATAAGEMVAA